jgi:hypothetical protein
MYYCIVLEDYLGMENVLAAHSGECLRKTWHASSPRRDGRRPSSGQRLAAMMNFRNSTMAVWHCDTNH